MTTQATLPLPFPLDELRPYGVQAANAAPLEQRGPIEIREIRTKEILHRSTGSRKHHEWTINPYRGCEFGCLYCFGRSTHEFLGLAGSEEFERKIFVKRGADRALERRLKRTDLRRQPIALGTVTDPYQPAELRQRVTRGLLETLDRSEGLTLSITTRSPLIVRDLELLARLNLKHAITVRMTLNTLDPVLARRIERGSPTPAERLEAAARVAGAGIPLIILCMPLMPGINAGSRQLLPIFESASRIGAYDLAAGPLILKTAARSRFWPWLRREFPHLAPRYRRLYRRRAHLRRADAARLTSIFDRLRLEMGFPR